MTYKINVLAGVLFAIGAGCLSLSGSDRKTDTKPAPDFSNKQVYGPAHPPTVLVVGTKSSYENEVRRTMTATIENKFFSLTTVLVDTKSSPALLVKSILSFRPSAIVLTHDLALELYRESIIESKYDLRDLPVFAAGISNIETQTLGLSTVTGITLETPPVVAFGNLSEALVEPIKSVAVLHRESRKTFVENQKEMFALEGIQLISTILDTSDCLHSSLKAKLQQITSDGSIDAIWIPNDRAGLTSHEVINGVWSKELESYNKYIVVEHPDFIAPGGLGDFAVLPSPTAFGLQIGDILSNYFSLGQFEHQTFKMPLSLDRILVVGRTLWQNEITGWRNFDRIIER